MPMGEMTPMPVMTTRRAMNGQMSLVPCPWSFVTADSTANDKGPMTKDDLDFHRHILTVSLDQIEKLVGEHKIVLGELQAGHVLIDMAEHQFDVRHFVRSGHNRTADRCALFGQLLDAGIVGDGFAGSNQAVEGCPGDLSEDDFFGVVAGLTHEDAGCLGHALND